PARCRSRPGPHGAGSRPRRPCGSVESRRGTWRGIPSRDQAPQAYAHLTELLSGNVAGPKRFAQAAATSARRGSRDSRAPISSSASRVEGTIAGSSVLRHIRTPYAARVLRSGSTPILRLLDGQTHRQILRAASSPATDRSP